MRVTHVSTHDIRGGAARSAHRLHEGLRARGVDSEMLVLKKHGRDDSVRSYEPSPGYIDGAARRLRGGMLARKQRKYRNAMSAGGDPFSIDLTRFGVEPARQIGDCDVVNLHWVAGFIDYPAFFKRVAGVVPIVWRPSDLNPLTGGCHYDAGCGKYLSACGACPQLGSQSSEDITSEVWRRKARLFEKMRPESLHFIAQSNWIASEIRASPWARRFAVTVIPNGIDTQAFAPRDARELRRALGIPEGIPVVLFVADSVDNKRKGFEYLVQALRQVVDQQDVCLMSVGAKDPQIELEAAQLHLGHIDNDAMLSLVYSAADVFVAPSVQDNLPNTVMEAMACGVPVVGFETGGIPDLVRDGKTGFLAPSGSVRGLAEAIARLIGSEASRKCMSLESRRVAVAEYRLEQQVERYIAAYNEVMQDFKRASA